MVPPLSFSDVMGILSAWAGAALVTYLTGEPMVGVIGIVSAYYLSKLIVLKR